MASGVLGVGIWVSFGIPVCLSVCVALLKGLSMGCEGIFRGFFRGANSKSRATHKVFMF